VYIIACAVITLTAAAFLRDRSREELTVGVPSPDVGAAGATGATV
jgi:hypothetical protein